MDTFSTIITVLCTLLGVLGGGSFFFVKSNKRIKAADARRAQAEARLAEIENKQAEIQLIHTQADEWKRLYNESEEERKELQEKLSKQIESKDELHGKYIQQQYRIGELELENQSLRWHKCVVKGCGLRKPSRDIDEVNDEQNTIETEDVQRLAIQ